MKTTVMIGAIFMVLLSGCDIKREKTTQEKAVEACFKQGGIPVFEPIVGAMTDCKFKPQQ